MKIVVGRPRRKWQRAGAADDGGFADVVHNGLDRPKKRV
jgi:hypothetical protein